MAIDYFSNWTEADKLAELRKVQEDIAQGSVLASAGAGEVNASRVIQETATRRWKLLALSLYRMDPVKYAGYRDVAVTQTTARFGTA